MRRALLVGVRREAPKQASRDKEGSGRRQLFASFAYNFATRAQSLTITVPGGACCPVNMKNSSGAALRAACGAALCASSRPCSSLLASPSASPPRPPTAPTTNRLPAAAAVTVLATNRATCKPHVIPSFRDHISLYASEMNLLKTALTWSFPSPHPPLLASVGLAPPAARLPLHRAPTWHRRRNRPCGTRGQPCSGRAPLSMR